MFSDAGARRAVVWKRSGIAGDPNWSTVDPAEVTRSGCQRPRRPIDALQRRSGRHRVAAGRSGRLNPAGLVLSSRRRTRASDRGSARRPLFTSVGRNAKLLLNVPPTKDEIATPRRTMSRLASIQQSSCALQRGSRRRPSGQWRSTGARRKAEIDLGGQRPPSSGSRRHRDGSGRGALCRPRLEWRRLAADLEGPTIGYAKLDRFCADSRAALESDHRGGCGGAGPTIKGSGITRRFTSAFA